MSTQTKLSLLEKRVSQINDPAISNICGGAIEDEDGRLWRGYYDEQKAWHKRFITQEELEYHERNCKKCKYFIILDKPKLPKRAN